MPLRIIFAKLLRIAECGAGQQVEFSHLCPDQALDVATEARLCRRAPFDRDAGILAPSLESTTSKVGPVTPSEVCAE
ncbi:hypothetical protein [Ensifer adhaerens]|uniref:hypothetical protein n=1 Tax=Ensifer adhaerens TaxID=106592 RepID=UPI001FF000EC|nr:hypothetical protein [Ensifer adhaerens]